MLSRFFGSPNINKKTVISDNDIKNKSINEINELNENKENEFKLSNNAMTNAFEEKNIDKLKYLKNNFSLTLPGNGNYHVDISVEEGDTNMAQFLITSFNCQPSLYAKQMATINGHNKLSLWVDTYATQRNDVGIDSVHKRYDRNQRIYCWSDVIPEQFRY